MYYRQNRIGGVMVSVLASSALDLGFEHLWGQTPIRSNQRLWRWYLLLSAKHASLRRNSND